MFIGINYVSKDKVQPVGFLAIEWMGNTIDTEKEICLDEVKLALEENNTIHIINTLIARSI